MILCAYCGEREAFSRDEHLRPVCIHCSELPSDEPADEDLALARAIVDRAVFVRGTVN